MKIEYKQGFTPAPILPTLKSISNNSKKDMVWGFTLLELLVVMVILGILSSVVLMSYKGYDQKAKINRTAQWSKSVHSLLGAYAVGVWSFDNIQGTTVYDDSGNNNGQISGTVSVVDGIAGGNGLNLNGGYVNCGNDPSIRVVSSMTLEFWAKPNNIASPSRQNPVCKAYGGEFCLTMEPSGGLSYYHGSAGANGSPYMGLTTAGMLANNIWTHIAIVRNNETRTIYVYKDSKLVNTRTWTSGYDPAPSASYNFQIGAGYVNRFYGIIDEVRFYKEMLTQTQIEQHYAQGLKIHQNLAMKFTPVK